MRPLTDTIIVRWADVKDDGFEASRAGRVVIDEVRMHNSVSNFAMVVGRGVALAASRVRREGGVTASAGEQTSLYLRGHPGSLRGIRKILESYIVHADEQLPAGPLATSSTSTESDLEAGKNSAELNRLFRGGTRREVIRRNGSRGACDGSGNIKLVV
eukprot:s1793_g6.t1